jgi:hypothetical protein
MGDIFTTNQCKFSSSNWTKFVGDTYENDTGLDGKTFLTGSESFTVSQIEVFEIVTESELNLVQN